MTRNPDALYYSLYADCGAPTHRAETFREKTNRINRVFWPGLWMGVGMFLVGMLAFIPSPAMGGLLMMTGLFVVLVAFCLAVQISTGPDLMVPVNKPQEFHD